MKFNLFYFEPYKDLFGYYQKIKQINDGYRLYFNKKSKRFTIVNINNNFEICKEYLCFSGNILYDLRFFNTRNSKRIFDYIDSYNNKLQKDKTNLAKEKSSFALQETLKISNRFNSISGSDINKIIEETKC